jgi:hypothetical protein
MALTRLADRCSAAGCSTPRRRQPPAGNKGVIKGPWPAGGGEGQAPLSGSDNTRPAADHDRASAWLRLGMYTPGQRALMPVDWRWQRAVYHVDHDLHLAADGDAWLEAAVRLAGALQRHGEGCLEAAEGVGPVLAAAHALRAGPALRRWLVESWTLTGSPDVVAAEAGVPEEVVQAYLALWFDVRGLLGAKGYIAAHVIPPCPRPDLGLVLRAFGYHFGPHALRQLLAVLVPPGDECGETVAERADPLIVKLAVASYLAPAAPDLLRLYPELRELLPPGGGYGGDPARRRQRLAAVLRAYEQILRRGGSVDDMLLKSLFGEKRSGRRGGPPRPRVGRTQRRRTDPSSVAWAGSATDCPQPPHRR